MVIGKVTTRKKSCYSFQAVCDPTLDSQVVSIYKTTQPFGHQFLFCSRPEKKQRFDKHIAPSCMFCCIEFCVKFIRVIFSTLLGCRRLSNWRQRSVILC